MEEENYSSIPSATSRALASAKDGEGFLIAYKQSGVRGDPDPITGHSQQFVRPSLGIMKIVEESVSIRGLGALRLYFLEAPLDKTFDPSIVAEFFSDSIGSEARVMSFNSAGIRNAYLDAPEKLAVKEQLDDVIHTLAELEAINSSAYLYDHNFERSAEWPWRLIIPRPEATEDYGTVWIPKGQAPHLMTLEPPNSPLVETHSYTNVLASKHRLLKLLGFAGFIDRDLLRIQRWQALQNQGRAA